MSGSLTTDEPDLGEPTLAEAFLAKAPDLGEGYLRELVADLGTRLTRIMALLESEQTPHDILVRVTRFYLDRPFQAARPEAGLHRWRWDRDWEALVAAIGTQPMRDRVAGRRDHEAAQAAEIAARLASHPRAPDAPAATPSPPPSPSSGAMERLREAHRATHLLREDPDAAAAYAAARLGTPFADDPAGQRLAARLERQAFDADLRSAQRGRPPAADGLADDERIIAAIERYWTPARVLDRVMRPATRALARLRRAERAVDRADGRLSQRRALDDLGRVRSEWDVAAALAADLDAERALLRPVVEAAIDGTSRRWRHRQGRVFDEKGVDLYPPCLRPWQVI